jgi:tetratricopeptide (TPR) repeat protein
VPCGTAAPGGGASSGSPKSNADRFPFPGEGSGAGDTTGPLAPAAAAPGADGAAKKSSADEFPFPESGAAPAAAAKKSPAGDFPFPEDDSKAGAGGASSSSSSSSSSSDDASAPAAQPDAAGDKSTDPGQPQGRHLLHRVNPIGTKLQTADEREAEDLDIAHYYTDTGNLKGAYLRSQDAVQTAPEDADAHFALAEAALKLNKRDEAIAEYNACLKLGPDDKEAKAARKELARLKP